MPGGNSKLKILYEEDKSVLSHLAHADAQESDLTNHFRSKPSDLRRALEIDTGIYAERNTSTWLNISCIANFDSARVDFYLGKTNKDENKKAYDILVPYLMQ